MKKRGIGVFCSSSDQLDKKFYDTASKVGEWIGRQGYHLIYGGASVGMMGRVADACLENGGEVTGVMVKASTGFKEIAHTRLSQLITVDSMSERKSVLIHLSEVLLVLPGGIGTLDELLDVLVTKYLHFHQKKIFLFDSPPVWQPFLDYLKILQSHQLVEKKIFDLIERVYSIEDVSLVK